MNIILSYPNTEEEINKFGKKRNEREIFNVVEYSLLDQDGQKCRQTMRGDAGFDPEDRNHYVINPMSTKRELLLDKNKMIKTNPKELHYRTRNGVPTKIELTGVEFLNVINPITIFSQPTDVALKQRVALNAKQPSKIKGKQKEVQA